ncbi:unnamed protein product [Rhizopus microsporus]
MNNGTKKRLASPSTEKPGPKKIARPSIVATKASQARADAIRSAQQSAAAAANGTTSKVHRKKPDDNSNNNSKKTPTLAKSYHTKASSLKQRPAWDLRGKVTDMTQLYKLNLEMELEIVKETKESEEKEAIQRAAALRTEIQSLERKHINDVEELHNKHRIDYQKLEDENLNFSRRLTTRDIEVSDAKRKLDLSLKELEQIKEDNKRLRESLENMSNAFKEAETERQTLKSRINRAEMSISDHEKEIEGIKKEIEASNSVVQRLQSKVAEAHAVRDRLLNKVKDLEESKKVRRETM